MALTLKTPEGCPHAAKVLIAAAYSKVSVAVETVTRDKKGYSVAGNPLKKVPVLETEAGVLFESSAIARYVAKQNGNPASLFGTSPVEAAQVDSYITFASTEIEPPVNSWVWTAEKKLPENPALVKAASSDSRKLMSSLDQVLKTKTFLVGERVTLADIVVACALLGGFRAVFDGKLRKPFKNVCRWFTTIVNQPEVAGVVGPVTLAGDKRPCNAGVAGDAPAVEVAAPAVEEKKEEVEEKKEEKKEEEEEKEEDDDDFDVFGDDDDDEEHEAEIQRIADAAAAAKAAKGKVHIAKSVVVLDVKPWDTETDLKALEEKIRGIEMEGLEWKGAELKPVAYGLKKIMIMCHIVDTQVSVDDLQDKIGEFADDVQSTDVVTFTKL